MDEAIGADRNGLAVNVSTARWSLARRGRLDITDSGGDVIQSYAARHWGDRPDSEMLWRNGWLGYPGSEWEEEPPGHWSMPVFPESDGS
jgi:hypothetical protein